MARQSRHEQALRAELATVESELAQLGGEIAALETRQEGLFATRETLTRILRSGDENGGEEGAA